MSGWHGAVRARRAGACRRLGGLVAIVALATCFTAKAARAEAWISASTLLAQAPPSDERKSFDIPAQPLAGALNAFGRQAGFQVTVDAATTAGVQAREVSGNFTPNEALARLLDDTGITWRFSGARTVVLEKIPAKPGVLTLDPVRVEGKGENAWGPVVGYTASRSATATKTDTPIRDIPQSIQVVPDQVIKDQQAVGIEDAVRNVSGVYRENTFGNTLDRFTLRGFTQRDFLRDGYRDPTSGNRILSGVERVEVLKGPGSILYGRLEPGGVINIVSKRPQETAAYFGELQVGSFDFSRVQVDASGPVTEDKSLLFRFNGAYENSGTFREPSDVNTERVEIAPSLSWRPGKQTYVWLQASYQKSEVLFDRGLVAIGSGVADIPNNRFLGEPGDFLFNEQYGFAGEIIHRFDETWRLRQGFRGNWFNSHDYRAEAAGNVNATTGVLNRRFSMNDNEGFSLMSQTDLLASFATGGVEHEMLAGVDLSRDETGGLNGSNPTLVPINIFSPVYGATPLEITDLARDDRNTTDGLGVYLQDQLTVRDDLKLLLGGRFDAVRYTGRDFLDGETREQSDSAWTPRVGAVYQPNQIVSLYASYSEGFSPVTSGNLAGGEAPKPTTSTQYEAGVKLDLFDGKLSSTLAAFHLTKQNVATADPNDPDFIVQTGEVRSQGFEFDVSGQVLPGWDVIGSYAFIDAEVTEDNTIPVGNRPASVPKHGASLWSVYRLQSSALQGLGFGAGLYYVGRRKGDLSNSFFLPSYIRTDATVFYEQDHWRAGINVKNLFDSDYIAASSGRTRIDPGIPLTVIGSISVRF
ncbi:MAG: TonB-dependent siderophore receptor [Alphaproteobacteria bacterium]|nr:TonB-dependent siderophore receptor [Alphaproteobacteria bacterium]